MNSWAQVLKEGELSGRGKVFVVDDQPEVIELLSDLLRRKGRQVKGFADGDEALVAIDESDEGVDLVVLDLDLGAGRRDGLEILTDLRKRFPDLPCVILTGKAKVDDAVKAMRLGATDFIEKDTRLNQRLDLQMEKLDRLTRVLTDNRRLRHHNMVLEQLAGMDVQMVGQQSGLSEVMEKVRYVAGIPRPVLILGERGTGKELVAHSIHAHSGRKGPFVTINCAALPQELAEAELFGYEKGAFTDAGKSRTGKFELAHEGTLFLDEVGNMPLELQQKILRVIEYQNFSRLGSESQISVDVKIVAATNADLDAAMREGAFRRDLYDRLTFETIEIPPLRQRKQDIEDLCNHFIERFRQEVPGIKCRSISSEALSALFRLEFPGNVRELKNMIERAAYRCNTQEIQLSDLGLDPMAVSQGSAYSPGKFRQQVREFERGLLQRSLEKHKNMTNAAKSLGLSYDQMRRLVKKHDL